MKESIIYFILDEYSNSVKIGYTTIKGLKKRIETLQIGTPNELTLLGATWGDKKIEKQLHEKFHYSHIRGEWFHYTKELEEFIAECWDFRIIESLKSKMYNKLIYKSNEVKNGKQF